jgi:two-component system sensor histidine kinase KdpD
MSEGKAGAGGRLKVYLGYAAGVGKTYQMLLDAQEAARTGVDVLIGYFEPHGRKDTIARTAGLEQAPRRRIEYRGGVFEEMDTEAILRRAPALCLVDELAHTNVPGAGREKRWEDVLALLERGIDVWTTVNVQHLESINDQVFEITGVRVRETLPDWVLKRAAEVVMVDATPQALLNRLRRGVIYAPDKAQRALENFFKESTLVALREVALRETAHEVELRQVTSVAAGDSGSAYETATPLLGDGESGAGEGKDRILIHLTADAAMPLLIRRARRMADYLHAECYAAYVESGPWGGRAAPKRPAEIERVLNFARNLHIETRILESADTARALAGFARLHRITEIFLARPRFRAWDILPGRNLIHRILREAPDIEIVIVAERHKPGA